MSAPPEDPPFFPCGRGCLCMRPPLDVPLFPGEACICEPRTVYAALIWWRKRAMRLEAERAAKAEPRIEVIPDPTMPRDVIEIRSGTAFIHAHLGEGKP